MKFARFATVVLALLAGLLAGCQTDSGGASSSGTTSGSGSSGSSGGY